MAGQPPWQEKDIPKLMRVPKIIHHPFPKPVRKPAHPSMLRIHIQLHHLDGTIVSGMEAIIEWREDQAISGCNERYMLLAHIGSDFIPIFRLEVYPRWKRSHTTKRGEHIYGPHIHYQNRVRRTSAAFDCGDEHRWKWWDRFMRHIHADMVYDSVDDSLFDPRSLPLF